jgi:hypothetical protein
MIAPLILTRRHDVMGLLSEADRGDSAARFSQPDSKWSAAAEFTGIDQD